MVLYHPFHFPYRVTNPSISPVKIKFIRKTSTLNKCKSNSQIHRIWLWGKAYIHRRSGYREIKQLPQSDSRVKCKPTLTCARSWVQTPVQEEKEEGRRRKEVRQGGRDMETESRQDMLIYPQGTRYQHSGRQKSENSEFKVRSAYIEFLANLSYRFSNKK